MHSVKKDLQQILAGVYSPAQLDRLIPKLMKMIKAQPHCSDEKRWVDESDIMLDHLWGFHLEKRQVPP